MATQDQMQAAYDRRILLFPDIKVEVERIGWSEVRAIVADTAEFVVKISRSVMVSEEIKDTHPSNVSRWLEENIGSEGMRWTGESPFDYKWALGCWDWFPHPPDDSQLEFYFLDETDAAAFRIRWA